jgi:Ca2+-binding RTX toxin-like protein
MSSRLRASRTSLKRMSAGGVVLALVALFGLPMAPAFAAGPTVVDIVGTDISATSAAGEAASLTVGNSGPVAGGGISIKDTGPAGNGTTRGAGAIAAGCTQATADEVRCPLGTLATATISTGDGNDTVFVLNDDVVVTVNGGLGNDDLRGGPGIDHLNGQEDNDTLRGGAGGDLLDGGTQTAPGGDTADYGSASVGVSVSLDGAANDGTPGENDNATNFEIVKGSTHNDTLTGGAGNETLNGGNGNDTLVGGGGDDTLVGGSGADDMDGGGHTLGDTVTYNPSAADVVVTLDNVANDGGVGELDNVRDTNEIILGGVGDDSITGSGNAETLNGGGGNDTLNGAGGADLLIGGTGSDTASYAGGAGGTITLDLTANDPGGDNVQTENVIGGTGVDTITGDAGPNRLDGGPGGDTVNGGGGADVLVGGAGDGADTYNGGAAVDTLTYAGLAGPVTIRLNGTAGTDGDVANSVENANGSNGNDTIVGSAAANKLNGLFGDDTLEGDPTITCPVGGTPPCFSTSNDQLIGERGNDILRGRNGADTLNPGTGLSGTDLVLGPFTDADTLDGGTGIDTVSYSTRTADVTVTIGAGANDGVAGEGDNVFAGVEKVTGGSGDDTITGDVSAETLTGGAGDDTLNGAGGNDVISGQGGNDIITGGPGKDNVSGGPGNDIFHTQDGIKDSLNCGDGDDNIADTDGIDDKAANCVP